MKGCDGSDLATIRYYRRDYVSNQKRTVRDEPVCWWIVQQLDFFGVDVDHVAVVVVGELAEVVVGVVAVAVVVGVVVCGAGQG